MKKIQDIELHSGDVVLVRVDYNVPLDSKGGITETLRIDVSKQTIKYLKNRDVKVVIVAHLGEDGELSLRPVYKYLKEIYPELIFCDSRIDSLELIENIKNLKNGGIILLENIRRSPEEKENDKEFCEKISKIFDVYINECFSVSHRKHASTYGIPMLMKRKAIGFQTIKEIENLSVTHNPPHPFMLIQGGVKINTKLPILEKLVPIADGVILAGALLNTVLRSQGKNVGISISEKIELPYVISQGIESGKIVLPKEVVVRDTANQISIKNVNNIDDDDYIGDMTHEFVDSILPELKNAKLILFNGSLGDTTNREFEDATKYLLEVMKPFEESVIIGGGDTSAFVKKYDPNFKGFLSTGGGATLDYIAEGTLPGLTVLL